MAKQKTVYICQQCGAQAPKWQGQCSACGAWNSLSETIVEKKTQPLHAQAPSAATYALEEIVSEKKMRLKSGIVEFDRALGGGLVPGAVILLGGDPGIGKSTLTLQVLAHLPADLTSLYVSAEESLSQIKLRAERLAVKSANLAFVNETDADKILTTIEKIKPQVVVLDSIQAISTEDLSGITGSVGQVRECASRIVRLAKEHGITIMLIGHVTKEGAIAGPKVLEHMVDTVLYLEGDSLHQFRILRASKNRYGSLGEIGLFEMREEGMIEVSDPAGMFTSAESEAASGSVSTIVMEGSRALAVELQALTVPSGFGYPKRTTSGFPLNRLQLLIAVLTRRANLRLFEQDVYANVVGGYQLKETATDLAACLAIASSLRDKVLPKDLVTLGEVNLSGSIRQVSHLERRVKEAARLGYKKVLLPQVQSGKIERYKKQIEIIPMASLTDCLRYLQM